MPRVSLRTPIAVFAVLLAVAPAACDSGTPTSGPATRTISRQPSASATSPAAPTPTTSAPAGTPSPSASPPAGAGLRGRTVVLNCPVDRADPPCPATPAPARVVVLNKTGQTVLATDADGRFTVALPAGSYVIRAAATSGTLARRPVTRPVTVAAGRYTTVTIRLITGLS
ncbi:carboxypeptidase-like regulatory domain-containing protein [Actinoplanes subtropicus]|uniref:carboxypeptidase-like regulatory domain-containing protein n=1 Tax=Actinoplanes subtropicus TaxID=543632 RepID=UPI0004C2BF8D|nr:carboxypeptidase-like regulatory domain-containing protein [Actinoplanes subtropicus]